MSNQNELYRMLNLFEQQLTESSSKIDMIKDTFTKLNELFQYLHEKSEYTKVKERKEYFYIDGNGMTFDDYDLPYNTFIIGSEDDKKELHIDEDSIKYTVTLHQGHNHLNIRSGAIIKSDIPLSVVVQRGKYPLF